MSFCIIPLFMKCLVTTNPNILSDRQRMDPIAGLLWLCKYEKGTNLQQFEALMALTNLASCNDEIKNSIAVHHKGIPIIQSLQYSDHPLVRRAATEMICNIAIHPEALRNFKNKDRLKIWFALAEDYETDLATARASAGALAMVAADPGTVEKTKGGRGKRRWHNRSFPFELYRRCRVDGGEGVDGHASVVHFIAKWVGRVDSSISCWVM